MPLLNAPICIIAPISSWAAAVAAFAEDGQGLTLFIRALAGAGGEGQQAAHREDDHGQQHLDAGRCWWQPASSA